ncbi:hypothetical protein KVR01_010942 [Diaporthe batatas]|uniref:uncharacterized protein n=1 Tax=Diaporthe batatas TaxID=748121 RepID=UPI001D036618|nr:uncharacterized protein KVR01_010942 [Diaporthe batatas]KAG8159281.1 hypothetical protein KVR01_010942 [Diaporthe batatas]
MGKERPLPGATKKKVSEDKVSKNEGRHKKHKRLNVKRHDSDDESSKDPNEQEGGVSLLQHEDEKTASNSPLSQEEKKRRKKEKRLRKEALRELMENAVHPSPTASRLDVEAGVERRDKRKRDKLQAQQPVQMGQTENEGANPTEGHEPADGEDVSMIDAKQAPAERKELQAQSEDEDMEDGGALLQPGYTAPPSGKNRVVRRRLNLIDRERLRIQKKLGVKEGSDENAQKVQDLLNKFIVTYDAKAERREVRKNERKGAESTRLRCRAGHPFERRGSRN